MAYHTVLYLLVFLPITAVCYQLFPKKARWMVLLLSSYIFYWSFSGALLFYLIGSSLFTHYICVMLDWVQNRDTAKKILRFGIIVMLGVLIWTKYRFVFAVNLYRILNSPGIFAPPRAETIILPLGISFYTLQAVGYMTDVYWHRTEVFPHPGKTALFLGFFPQIMEGPISSYTQTADSLWKGEPIRFCNLSEGSIRILWGLFKKLIIADRLYVPVSKIFDEYKNYHGALIAAAAIGYTIQLYMEFSGCMDIVNGSSLVFGIRLPENFRQPFFAVDAADFWRRWHISLGTWFRTYVFFPITVSSSVKKAGTFLRTRYNTVAAQTGILTVSLFCVWICNGFWHGPRWSFIFYGMYYFLILLLASVFAPVRKKILKKSHIRSDALWYRVIRMMKTWIIIFTGELFFRAEGLDQGIYMFKSMFRDFSLRQLFGRGNLGLGLDMADYIAVAGGCMIVLAVDIIKETNILGNKRVQNFCLPLRWSLYYALIFSVIFFGAYGTGYQTVDLIYAGF